MFLVHNFDDFLYLDLLSWNQLLFLFSSYCPIRCYLLLYLGIFPSIPKGMLFFLQPYVRWFFEVLCLRTMIFLSCVVWLRIFILINDSLGNCLLLIGLMLDYIAVEIIYTAVIYLVLIKCAIRID